MRGVLSEPSSESPNRCGSGLRVGLRRARSAASLPRGAPSAGFSGQKVRPSAPYQYAEPHGQAGAAPERPKVTSTYVFYVRLQIRLQFDR